MNTIVIPRELLVEWVRQGRRTADFRGVTLPAGLNCVGSDLELLVQPVRRTLTVPTSQRVHVDFSERLETVRFSDAALGANAALFLGTGAQRGRARGFIQMEPGAVEPLDCLSLVGPGMSRVPLLGAANVAAERALALPERWSRTAGALGHDVWRRFTELKFVVIGAGRSGSALCLSLVRSGVRGLAVVDPDRVELHNVGEGVGFRVDDVGRPKVEALLAFLASQGGDTELEALPVSITHLRALNAVAAADLVCCAPDHNSARLAASYLAALFYKPLLDVGTGILGDAARREMGADVRLVWPGRCLLCAGGLRDVEDARARLASADAERELRDRPRDFRTERAGSLASLNGLAVSAALRLLEDFVAGRVRENGTWLHLQFDDAGRLATSYPATGAVNESRLLPQECACRFAGSGEDGLPMLVAELRRETTALG